MHKVLSLIFIMLFTACQSNSVRPEKPAWVSNPGDGAVGSSVTHIKGRHYQENWPLLERANAWPPVMV